jgi:hypothetical protein
MYTIAVTPEFRHDVDAIWSTEERLAFCAWLAANPEAGDVIPGVVVAARCGGRRQAAASAAAPESFTATGWTRVASGCW